MGCICETDAGEKALIAIKSIFNQNPNKKVIY
jgi:hypothetical protein